jgi:flagellar FliL protein
MKKIILPVILICFGIGAGAGGGYFLRPHDNPDSTDTIEHAVEALSLTDFVKMNNQFVVPVVEQGRVTALVILSLTLEVVPGSSEDVYLKEPKLRDALLQVMFDHANAGGFKGVFTDGANLILLRAALRETAQKLLGDMVIDVLIADLARQDS